jgi:hypothetical protein
VLHAAPAAVQVLITPRRLVRPLGGAAMHDSVQRLLDVIMEDYWNFKAPEAAGKADAGDVRYSLCLPWTLLTECETYISARCASY